MFLIPKPQADSAIAGNWFKLYTELGMLTVSIDADFFEPEAKTDLVSQDVDVARLSEKLHIAFEMDQIEVVWIIQRRSLFWRLLLEHHMHVYLSG